MKQRRGFLLVFGIGFLVYVSALWGGFVWDDRQFVLGDARTGSLSFALGSFARPCGWASPGEPCSIYRPLRTLSFALDRKLWGSGPFGYHLSAALLHALAGGLVYLVAGLMLGRPGWASIFGALLFAVHPVHTEAVAWVSSRAELIGAVFSLSAFYFYLRGWWWLSVAGFALGLLSKETSVSLFAAVAAHGLIFGRGWRSRRAFSGLWLAYGAVAAGYLALRQAALGGATQYGFAAGGYYQTLATQLRSFGHYLELGFFPVGLLSDYIAIEPSAGILEARVLAALGLLACLAWLVARSRSRLLAFCLIWWFVFLLPTSSLILPINYFLAERWLYMPSFALSLFAGWAWLEAGDRWPWLSRRYAALGLATLALFAALTSARNLTWRNSFSLWSDVAIKSPENPYAHHELGLWYAKKGLIEKEEKELSISVGLRPDYTNALADLGVTYAKKGSLDRAVAQLKMALRRDADHKDAAYNLASAYIDLRAPKRSIAHLEGYAHRGWRTDRLFRTMGRAYMELGSRDKAEHNFKTAMNLMRRASGK